MTSIRSALLCAAGALLFSAVQVYAGPPPPPTPAPTVESPWEFRFEPYLWGAGITGVTGVRSREVPVDLGFKKLFDHLKMAIPVEMEVRYKRFGLLTDIMYADIGGYIETPFDRRVQQLAIDDKMLIFQVIPNYRLWRSDKGFFDLLGGLRGWSMKLRLTDFRDIGPIGRPNFIYENRSQSKTWVDLVGGARGQYFLYQGLFVAAYGDIGGGSSELTWQVQGTLGYKFSKLVSAEVGWRLLSDDYRSGGFTYNVKQQGVFAGVSFTW
ncbi:hypothetical protein AYO41_01745 [Verrucomicrobia bacterium SCGC AG-212-E04]|nr:hypothetical protein AYO41_01745 [Verrucomicrobia bacterium SCGC AG-212-E04]